ncbi:MAG: ComE operon protein 1 [Chloroflexi bacterium]|nr:ComE operon protein 1 [Chloroflexota bacterium]
MSDKITPQNLNTASASSLENLPGIGPSLAERIIANRPYAAVEDLRKVQGIGGQSLEKLRGLIMVEETGDGSHLPPEETPTDEVAPAEESPAPEEEASPQEEIAPFDVFEEETQEAEEIEEAEEVEAPEIETVTKQEEETMNLVTQSRALWMAFSSGLLALILALGLIFGILTSLNGGLHYAPQSQAVALDR